MALNSGIASLCIQDCGFYGSKENSNMCSKYYKDYLKAEPVAKSAKAVEDLEFQNLTLNPPQPEAAPSKVDISISISTMTTSTGDSPPLSGSSKKIINRCKSCSKKVGLTGFKCRCGQLFCGVHRYPKERACTFDFKNADREILVRQNPLITADKLTRRI